MTISGVIGLRSSPKACPHTSAHQPLDVAMKTVIRTLTFCLRPWTGKEYVTITFEDLHTRLCDALRGDKPRVIAQYLEPGGRVRTLFEDGTTKENDVREDGDHSMSE